MATDEDGTPLSHGERMTEVALGTWQDPLLTAVLEFLEKSPGRP